MRKSHAVVPLIFVIFGVALGASSRKISPGSSSADFMNRERVHEEKMREGTRQLFSNERSRSSVDLKLENTPVIEHQKNSNVKTSLRRNPSIAHNSEGREPSIQAYGLPKRTVENNGFIERVSEDDDKLTKVDLRRKEPSIQAYGMPKRVVENNGFIERIGDNENTGSPSASINTDYSVRRSRSIDGHAKNDLVDLEAQEAKVFRPLFVYRQQVADRYRIKPRKNPIYGAYQYGNKRQKNSIDGSRKYYSF